VVRLHHALIHIMAKTLFDKIWDKHVVQKIEDGPSVLYIDKHFIHEVTSPQAFNGIEKRGLKVFRPNRWWLLPITMCLR
jgi:3-isopropylmalate/(R)-2-methylmalate dehydratase large subunit